MNITVTIKSVYGTDMIYPVCDRALLLAKLVGKKTFSASDIQNIKQLGYGVDVATPVLVA